jgi:hypothetical protein
MKKILITGICVCLFSFVVFAQDEEEEVQEKGFKKENLFTGGSITVSFFNGQTLLGANPVFGYKLADWVDAGIAFNYVYNGVRDYRELDDKVRQTTYGPGAFVRLYPFRFLFVQGQYERNFSTLKYRAAPGSVSYVDETYKANSNSLLLGGGIAQGREEGSTSFYYISVLFDVLKDVNSPYVDVHYSSTDPNDYRVRIRPIIRAGVNIGLFQGRYR